MISNSIDSDAKTCPECHSAIPADAPGGICPGCVIGLGLSGVSAGIDDPTMDMPKSSGPATAFIAPSPEDLDKFFEHLSIESLLGQGGMGAVYKARQISLDRTVAVKILPPYAGNDPSFLERFQREARALAKLTHPNIVMVFEFGQVSEMFYFVMEYVEGVNLREAIVAGGLSTHESMRVIPQICEALQFAHDAGIVHRDIKPENILLDSKGRVKIADFGLAKLLERNAINFTLTSTNQVLGTVKYMAPEQIENPNMVDHRSDIYSLGVVFYELLTGELPLGRFDPPSAMVPANQPLDPVVMRTLEKQPLNRFQQASEVRTAVENIVIDDDSVPPQKPIQDPHQRASKSRSAAKRLPAVNFQLTKVFAGFGKGKGLMRVDLAQEEIILDIEIKDFLGGLFRSEFKQVRIGFEHILAFKDEFTWYSAANLEIQTDYFQEFATLPGAENGKVQLVFTSKDKKQASALCELVKEQLGLDEQGREQVEQEPVPEPLNVQELSHQLDKPANGFFIAGVVDLLASVVFLISAILVNLNNTNSVDLGVSFALMACWSVCVGVFEIYLCFSSKSMQNYWVVLIGCAATCLLWFHIGALLMIPCTIYMLWQLSKEKFRRGFSQSEAEQQDDPSQRSIVFADAQQQIELRNQLFWPTLWLGLAGLIAVVIASAVAISVEGGGARGAIRFKSVVFSISVLGLVNVIGALMLRFNPSIFWAKAVVKFSKFPTNLMFPIAWWAGRSIDRIINDDEFRNRSGNPYVQKDEGFTVA